MGGEASETNSKRCMTVEGEEKEEEKEGEEGEEETVDRVSDTPEGVLGDLVGTLEFREGVVDTLQDSVRLVETSEDVMSWQGNMVILGGGKTDLGEKGSRASGKKDIMPLMLMLRKMSEWRWVVADEGHLDRPSPLSQYQTTGNRRSKYHNIGPPVGPKSG